MELPPVSSLLDIRGKVALVTGASGGIGAGIATRLAEAGASVVVHYHASEAAAHRVVEAITASGGQAVAYQADVSDSDAVHQLIRDLLASFGRLDVLVNNAGIYPQADLLTMTREDWDAMMTANLRSAFLCTQAAARQMVAQGQGGAVVNIASIEAVNPAPGHSHYGAAKAGVVQLTRAAASELGSRGIRVNAVSPGLIWREGIEKAWPEGVKRYVEAAPLGRLGRPEDVADACLFLASPAARWITGTVLTVDGGVMTCQVY